MLVATAAEASSLVTQCGGSASLSCTASMESAAKAPLKAAGRLSRDDGDACAVERAAGRLQQSADLHRRPFAAARRGNATLLQARCNGPLNSRPREAPDWWGQDHAP